MSIGSVSTPPWIVRRKSGPSKFSEHVVTDILKEPSDMLLPFMVGIRRLRGQMFWIADVLPRTLWAVGKIYAVVTTAQVDVRIGQEDARRWTRQDTRNKAALVAVERRNSALMWGNTLLPNIKRSGQKRQPHTAGNQALVDNGRFPWSFGAVLINPQPQIPLEEASGAWAENDKTSQGLSSGSPLRKAWPTSQRS